MPASSEIYQKLEAVSAFFPARGVFLGDRGASGRQLAAYGARLGAAVAAARAGPRKTWAERELADIAGALLGRDADSAVSRAATSRSSSGSRLQLASRWRADVAGSDALTERMPDNGLGSIDAVTNGFESAREGWPVENGASAALAPAVAGATRWGGAALEARFSSHVSPGRPERVWQGRVHRAYARGVWRNVALRAGAEEMRWGQSPIGALFISGNAAPFPALEVATDTAIVLPWWLRFAGPTRATLFLADLGARQDPPHAKLAGWQVSVAPWSRFELGVAVVTQTGGSGGPPASFFERVVDLFPVIDALAPQHADLLISNKFAGGNLRLRVPELSGLDLYYELQIDDFDGRRLRSSLLDDASHLIGARLPVIAAGGLLAFRGEWHNTALRTYEHTQFRSGYTYERHIIGSPLGPHAAAGYLAATWQPSTRSAFELLFADERRDPAMYTAIFDDGRERGWRFVRLTDDPDYRRARVVGSVGRSVGRGHPAVVRATLGYNLAWRPGQPRRAEWLAQLTFVSRRLSAF